MTMSTAIRSPWVASCAGTVSLSVLLYLYHVRIVKGIKSKWRQEKQAERTGRIRAEVKLRSATKQSKPDGGYHLKKIGTVVSPFTKRMGTPRQAQLVPSSRGIIELDIPSETLHGIDLYSHAWIIFEFHANTDLSASKKTKVKPPRANVKVGQLATRSPHRPNSIGLSLVKVTRLEGRQLHITSLDLVNGTPVFDIKPFVPWDKPNDTLRVPEWVDQDDSISVSFTPSAKADLSRCVDQGLLSPLYSIRNDGMDAALNTLSQLLSQDPRASNRRGKSTGSDEPAYRIVFCQTQVEFRVSNGQVLVTTISEADLTNSDYVDGIPLAMK